MAITDRTAEQLTREAQLASRIRTLKVDPDVVALHVERVRTQVEWLTWISIGLGLLFTLVNVQQFAAGSATPLDLSWWIAWLLDPMVSLALIAVLRAEMVTARYQLTLNGWAHATKWVALILTYIMNTWASFAAGSPAQVILHSVPVVMVFMVANAAPGIRDRLTEAVIQAAEEASQRACQTMPPASHSVPSQEQPAESVTLSDPTPLTSRSLGPTRSAPVAQPVVQLRPTPAVTTPVPGKKSSLEASRSDDDLRLEVERMALSLGRKPGIQKVKTALGIGSTRAERLLSKISDPARNGHRAEVS